MSVPWKRESYKPFQDAASYTQNLRPGTDRVDHYARWKIRPKFPCSSKTLDYPIYNSVPLPYHVKARQHSNNNHTPDVWSNGKRLVLPSVESPRVHYAKSSTHRDIFTRQSIKKGGVRHPSGRLAAFGIVPCLF